MSDTLCPGVGSPEGGGVLSEGKFEILAVERSL